ncbi:MAG: hypothetical protein EAZ09_22125 [Oscillatoriales cyanobacterium]|nr:MAG: hypothetical protein EAZ18_19100 [Oscillatoriales cyanobacterium]TAH16258.1 MAG: hypothetical protein EAZ09_22125 [Oscillatoriales cyanobacterium]
MFVSYELPYPERSRRVEIITGFRDSDKETGFLGNLWVGTEILQHCQQQARCLFHKEWISCGTGILRQQQARCLFHKEWISCGTGILPVHKRLVENGARSQLERSIVVKNPVSEPHDALCPMPYALCPMPMLISQYKIY